MLKGASMESTPTTSESGSSPRYELTSGCIVDARSAAHAAFHFEEIHQLVVTVLGKDRLGVVLHPFNVVLGVEFKDSASLQPDKAKYDAFMKKWGEANQAKSDEIVLTYPAIREIVGEYNMRSVTFK